MSTDWEKVIKSLPKGLTIAQICQRVKRDRFAVRYRLKQYGYKWKQDRKAAWTPEKRQEQGQRRWGKCVPWHKMKWEKYADFQIEDFVRNYYGFSVTGAAVRKARKIYGNGKI